MARRTQPKKKRRKGSKPHAQRESTGSVGVDVDLGIDSDAEADEIDVVRDGYVLDFISGTKELKETAKEQVRQRIARALFHEYGISVDDMEADFPVTVDGRRRRVDIAIFAT